MLGAKRRQSLRSAINFAGVPSANHTELNGSYKLYEREKDLIQYKNPSDVKRQLHRGARSDSMDYSCDKAMLITNLRVNWPAPFG
jgi:hypothetical protein